MRGHKETCSRAPFHVQPPPWFSSRSHSPVLRFRQQLERFFQNQAEDTRTSTLRRALMPSSVSRQLVTLIPRWAMLRSSALQTAAKTRQSVLVRSTAIQAANSTRPVVRARFLPTPPATATRRTVLLRSLATPPATATQPPVLLRSLAT